MKFIIFFFSFGVSLSGFAACISSDFVELRAKPSEKAKVTWTVGRYTPLLVGERQGAWYQVTDMDSKRHWVHARYLTTKYDCLIVRTSSANLRQSPSAQSPNTPLAYIRKYGTFKKLGRDEEWLKVQDEFGYVHWIHENTVWEPRFHRRMSF